MKPPIRTKIKSITDVLTPEQARAFLDVVRILKQQPEHENLMIRDERGETLGCLFLPECHASPDDPPTDPEFLKELERRLQFPEPAILIDDDTDLDEFFAEEEPE